MKKGGGDNFSKHKALCGAQMRSEFARPLKALNVKFGI